MHLMYCTYVSTMFSHFSPQWNDAVKCEGVVVLV